jgi:long-chain acyl-CoA synthetase
MPGRYTDDRPTVIPTVAGQLRRGVPAEVGSPRGVALRTVGGRGRPVRGPDRPDFFGATTATPSWARLSTEPRGVCAPWGWAPGNRVALVLPNCPTTWCSASAVLPAGRDRVEHNPLLTEGRVHSPVRRSPGPRWRSAGTGVVSTVRRGPPDLRQAGGGGSDHGTPLRIRLALHLPLPLRRAKGRPGPRSPRGFPGGSRRWDRQLSAATPLDPAFPRPGPADIAAIQYTGGTTGAPRGAVLTHRNLRANAVQGRAWLPGMSEGEETIYAVLPLFHSYGLTLCLTFAVSIGAAGDGPGLGGTARGVVGRGLRHDGVLADCVGQPGVPGPSAGDGGGAVPLHRDEGGRPGRPHLAPAPGRHG